MRCADGEDSIIWSNIGVSCVHENSKFMDMVRERKLIHVHRASVSSFSKRCVHLPSGAAVFATGWTTNQPTVFDPSLLPDLGLPFPIEQEESEIDKHWTELGRACESRLRTVFPMLAKPPPEILEYDKQHARDSATTPFRLFRNIVPPNLAARGERSMIVLGTLINTNVPTYAEVSSLWGIAYLENMRFSPAISPIFSDQRAMEEDISLLNTWSMLRFRDNRPKYLDGSVEIQDFTDLLMKDLGLRAGRKKWAAERHGKRGVFGLRAWVKEWFSPYRWVDYRGLVEEYKKLWMV